MTTIQPGKLVHGHLHFAVPKLVQAGVETPLKRVCVIAVDQFGGEHELLLIRSKHLSPRPEDRLRAAPQIEYW